MNIPISPDQASTIAFSVDVYFYMLVLLCSVLTIGIFTSMVFMALKFRKIEGEDRPSVPLDNVVLELTWTILPTIILLGLFVWSTWIYGFYLKGAPEESLKINVVGKQWMWKVQHSNGKREINDLHIPAGVPVELSLSSQDVIHDYYIPAFRVKQDAVPGRVTKLWFQAREKYIGKEYHIFCAEYCGTEHSKMGGTVYVMSQEDYEQWLEGDLPAEGAAAVATGNPGEAVYKKLMCVTCHSGAKGALGPKLTGMFGTEGTDINGETFTRDDDYIRQSIVDPTAITVEGFIAGTMQNFEAQLSEQELQDLIEYIKTN